MAQEEPLTQRSNQDTPSEQQSTPATGQAYEAAPSAGSDPGETHPAGNNSAAKQGANASPVEITCARPETGATSQQEGASTRQETASLKEQATKFKHRATAMYVLFCLFVGAMILSFLLFRKQSPWLFLWFAGGAVLARIGYYVLQHQSNRKYNQYNGRKRDN